MVLATILPLFRLFVSTGVGLALLLFLHESIRVYRPDIVDKENRVRSVPIDKILDTYDFIVVGGGSAGSVIASRLSEIPSWNVLLLEAGPDESLLSEVPSMAATLQHSDLDWAFQTVPSEHYCLATDGVCQWPRGKVLGGSSVLNAMMYVRGNRIDYDRWASLGNTGWDYNTMLKYFKKSEDMRKPILAQSPYHSTGGYLTVEPFRTITALSDVTIAAFREINFLNAENDVNGATQLGLTQILGTIRNGLRCSTNKAFLRPAWKRPNLHVSLNSFVQKILIDPKTRTAYGVQFQRDQKLYEVHSTRETILCAGSIQSPQLLMLSGVGPAQHLKEFGIDVIANSPGVGENLQDHVSIGGVGYSIQNPFSSDRLSINIQSLLNDETIREFILNQDGPLYIMGSENMAYINTKYQDPSVNWPDIQIYFTCGYSGSGVTNDNNSNVNEPEAHDDGMGVIPLLMRPESRGRIRLNSSDPMEYPLIYPNYFETPKDLEILIEGAKFAHKVFQTSIFRALNATLTPRALPQCSGFDFLSDEFWKCLARQYSQTIYHPAGTCKMGPWTDPMAVVDPRLRVHGVHNLRVIDASIMPYIVTGNLNAPTIAIAEKGADMIKEYHLYYRWTYY